MMKWLLSPVLLLATYVYSVVAVLAFWTQAVNAPPTDYAILAFLLAFMGVPYGLLCNANYLASNSLSRFTCALSNVLTIASVVWWSAYAFLPVAGGYGIVFYLVPLFQCLVGMVAILIALWSLSPAGRNGSV